MRDSSNVKHKAFRYAFICLMLPDIVRWLDALDVANLQRKMIFVEFYVNIFSEFLKNVLQMPVGIAYEA